MPAGADRLPSASTYPGPTGSRGLRPRGLRQTRSPTRWALSCVKAGRREPRARLDEPRRLPRPAAGMALRPRTPGGAAFANGQRRPRPRYEPADRRRLPRPPRPSPTRSCCRPSSASLAPPAAAARYAELARLLGFAGDADGDAPRRRASWSRGSPSSTSGSRWPSARARSSSSSGQRFEASRREDGPTTRSSPRAARSANPVVPRPRAQIVDLYEEGLVASGPSGKSREPIWRLQNRRPPLSSVGRIVTTIRPPCVRAGVLGFRSPYGPRTYRMDH